MVLSATDAKYLNNCAAGSKVASDCKLLGFSGCEIKGTKELCVCSSSGEAVSPEDAEIGDCSTNLAYSLANSVVTVTILVSILLALVCLYIAVVFFRWCGTHDPKYRRP